MASSTSRNHLNRVRSLEIPGNPRGFPVISRLQTTKSRVVAHALTQPQQTETDVASGVRSAGDLAGIAGSPRLAPRQDGHNNIERIFVLT